jgi:translocator protein
VKISKFVLSIFLCFFVAFLGSVFTLPSIPGWYSTLHKPFFNPPNWIFGPVWTILFFLMGVSFYIVWTENINNKKKESAIKIFILQLVLNLLWSLAFFGLHQPLLAMAIIVILWLSIFMTIKYFYKISRLSAYLLYPYIAWVSFASILNFTIVILNR